MQVAFGFRRQAAQLFGASRSIAQSRKQRPRLADDGRKSVTITLRPAGWTRARLSTNTRHRALLAFSLAETDVPDASANSKPT
ncbi:hypothetical protein [Bradyrhizobium sp.]|uniref:hypothetical protein n=1 Tax=Bradyrhizobium sp. TaxID=376 RepID=UPI003C34444C